MLYGDVNALLQGLQTLVLILIFLENALRPEKATTVKVAKSGLNPYFFGKCSTANVDLGGKFSKDTVLILIFLENALRQR